MRIFSCLLILAALLSLSACYRPLYGDKDFGFNNSAQQDNLNQVEIAGIPDQTGQRLRNLLIDRFYLKGRPANPTYELRTNLTLIEEKLGIQKDATATRARLELTATYSLYSKATGKRVYNGFSRSLVGYNILDQQYATQASRENAADRGVRELADLITTRIALALDDKLPQTEPAPSPATRKTNPDGKFVGEAAPDEDAPATSIKRMTVEEYETFRR